MFETLIKIFELDGFNIKNKKGDHVVMTKSGLKRPLIIKYEPDVIPATHIRTNLTAACISSERFFELLQKLI